MKENYTVAKTSKKTILACVVLKDLGGLAFWLIWSSGVANG